MARLRSSSLGSEPRLRRSRTSWQHAGEPPRRRLNDLTIDYSLHLCRARLRAPHTSCWFRWSLWRDTGDSGLWGGSMGVLDGTVAGWGGRAAQHDFIRVRMLSTQCVEADLSIERWLVARPERVQHHSREPRHRLCRNCQESAGWPPWSCVLAQESRRCQKWAKGGD